METGHSLDHYKGLIHHVESYAQHEDFDVEKVIAGVLGEGLHIKDEFPVKFWKWLPFFNLGRDIHKRHKTCCDLGEWSE